ncbi:hypothetical protein ASG82_06420 [Mycobacterium sp. Soil538]|nr:hypothetical protein ASG82_06420 [Mycobacterium sp. Soil538]
MTSVLPRLRPPAGPVSGRWSAGIGDAVAGLTRAPAPLSTVLRLLNHVGGLGISADAVEFDGDAVDWADVKSVETHSLIGYLLSDALDAQIGKLPLPRFPGRGLLLDLASDAVLTALVATAGGAVAGLLDVRIPAEVNYRGMIRSNRTLSAGVLATLLMADPAVRDALIATAQAHGVPVRRADDDAIDAAERRVRRWKER